MNKKEKSDQILKLLHQYCWEIERLNHSLKQAHQKEASRARSQMGKIEEAIISLALEEVE